MKYKGTRDVFSENEDNENFIFRHKRYLKIMVCGKGGPRPSAQCSLRRRAQTWSFVASKTNVCAHPARTPTEGTHKTQGATVYVGGVLRNRHDGSFVTDPYVISASKTSFRLQNLLQGGRSNGMPRQRFLAEDANLLAAHGTGWDRLRTVTSVPDPHRRCGRPRLHPSFVRVSIPHCGRS